MEVSSLAEVKINAMISGDMTGKTTTVITFEALHRTWVRRRQDPIFIRCGSCEMETEMFTASEFARRGGMTPRQLYRAIEAGAFHFIEEPDGQLLICGNSSAKQIKGER